MDEELAHNDHDDVHDLPDALDHDAIVDEAIDETIIPSIPPLPPSDPALDDHLNPTVHFARSLKLTQPPSATILSFDADAFTSKCNRTSPYHDRCIDFSVLAAELFVKNEIWLSKEVLFDTLSLFAATIGCKAVKSRDIIKLKSRNPNVKDDEGFYVKLRALHNEKKPAASPKDPSKSIAKARPVWEREVQIREVSCIIPESGKRSAEGEPYDHSTSFAYALKKVDGLSMIIVGFDEKTFEKHCCRLLPDEEPNPHYDEGLDMDSMAAELFKQNDVWISRDVLYHALSAFATVYGFKVVKTRNMLVCKRYGSDNGNRNWSAGPWKVGCPFSISLKALHTERRATENPKDPGKNLGPKCRPVWEREVLIKEANCTHGGGCRPGEERVVVAKKTPKVGGIRAGS
jgi:hypothetical protein